MNRDEPKKPLRPRRPPNPIRRGWEPTAEAIESRRGFWVSLRRRKRRTIK